MIHEFKTVNTCGCRVVQVLGPVEASRLLILRCLSHGGGSPSGNQMRAELDGQAKQTRTS